MLVKGHNVLRYMGNWALLEVKFCEKGEAEWPQPFWSIVAAEFIIVAVYRAVKGVIRA